MADNALLSQGDGGIIVATDKIGGVDYQRAKLVWGVDGTATDASASNPLPVVQTGTLTVTGPLTDTQLRASAVPVSGTFYQATQPVSGTFWQATQPVSGTVTANIGTSGSLALDATIAETHGTKAAGTAATKSELVGGVYNSGGVTLTNGQQAALQFTSAGALIISGGTASTQYAEDAAHASGDTGTVALVVRKDTPTQLAGTDGDYSISINDASGALWTHVRGLNDSGGTDITNTTAHTLKTTLYDASGTAIDFTAASPVTQSGTWTVQIGNTPNTTAIKVDGSAVTQPVSIAAAVSNASVGFGVQTTITRPANTTAYTANDVMGGAIDLGILGASGAPVLITSVQLEGDIAAVPSGQTSWILHLYNVTPPSALADNAAFDIASGDRASYLGQIALTTLVDQGSTLYMESNGINKQVKLSGTHLFGYLVTVGAFTPAANSEVYKISVHTVGL